MTDAILQLKKLVDESDNIVFFGGAGVSTECGIKDFRSVDGLYRQKFKYPPETILSHSFYESHTEEFYEFYRTKMLAPDAQPNAAHKKLAQWEREGKLKAVITQNIDGLHQKAGSREVLELHGSVLRNHCLRCGKFYGVEAVAESTGIPLRRHYQARCGALRGEPGRAGDGKGAGLHRRGRCAYYRRHLAGGISRGGTGALL